MADHECLELHLQGSGGESVSFRRLLASHGVATLPPNRIDLESGTLETTLHLGGRTLALSLAEMPEGVLHAAFPGGNLTSADIRFLKQVVRRMLRLDESPIVYDILRQGLLARAPRRGASAEGKEVSACR